MIYTAVGLALGGIILSVIRLIKGREIESRTVAVDIITTIVTAILVLFAHISSNSLLLDVALVYAILSFVAVIAVARYLEGGI